MKIFTKLLLMLATFCAPAFAANHYICPGATGTHSGAEWTDAYTGIGTATGNINPASMVRGDTYYVANGQVTLASAVTTFGVADSGTSIITIQKAVDGANGTNTGWTNGGTGTCNENQAVWGPFLVTTDYYTFNGATRGGTLTGKPEYDWRCGNGNAYILATGCSTYGGSAYGFYVNNNNGSNIPVTGITLANETGAIAGGIPNDNVPVHNLVVHYFEVNGSHNGGSGCDLNAVNNYSYGHPTGTYQNFDGGISISGGQTYGDDIQYNFIHDLGVSDGILIDSPGTASLGGSTLAHNWVMNTCYTLLEHSEMLSSRIWNGGLSYGLTIADNYLENSDGTAYFATPTGADNIVPTNWDFYGNVIFYNAGEAYAGQTGNGDGAVEIYNWATFSGYLHIYNNNISGIDLPGGACDIEVNGNSGATMGTMIIENNVFNGCNQTNISPQSCPSGGCTQNTWDYQSYFQMTNSGDSSSHKQVSASNPFTSVGQSASEDDFTLTTDTAAWTSLGSPYNIDIVGNTRTSSRGAFQYEASVGPWYISNSGSDSNNCTTISTPCQTFGHLMPLTSAGDTINILNMIRLSTSLSSTAGYIAAKANQTFTGPSCTPTSAQCTGGVSGSVQFTSGQINGPDGDGNYYVTGQTQAGTATQPTSDCDTGYTGCIYPEDLFVNGTPYQHLNLTSEAALSAGTWWFNYSTHTIYLPSTLTPTFVGSNTVETSVLETMFQPNAVNGVTVENLNVEEFAVPLLMGAIDPVFGNVTDSSSLNWIIQDDYITLNHGYGVRCAFGEQILNNVLTANGNFGTGGGCTTTASIIPSAVTVQGNTITYNNYAHVSPGFGAGGIKFGNTAGVVIRGNIVSNNIGQGIHFDTNSVCPLIDGNTVESNVDPVAEAGLGIEIEISNQSISGCEGLIRNNIVKYNGESATAGPNYQLQVASSNAVEAYCNVSETDNSSSHMQHSVVNASNRGNNSHAPGSSYITAVGNSFHHNTYIWDSGATSTVGYQLNDATNQPNFFANNTAPNYNMYHASSTGLTEFFYNNNSGGNNTVTMNFTTYQGTGGDPNGTIDTVYTSEYPTVSVTSPVDQASVANPVTINSTASDGSGIASVKFYVDWVLESTVTSGPYNYSWAGSGGTHTVAAMAVANSGVQHCNAVTLTQSVPGTPAAPSPPTGLTGSIH